MCSVHQVQDLLSPLGGGRFCSSPFGTIAFILIVLISAVLLMVCVAKLFARAVHLCSR